jgi:hypothetical protein
MSGIPKITNIRRRDAQPRFEIPEKIRSRSVCRYYVKSITAMASRDDADFMGAVNKK